MIEFIDKTSEQNGTPINRETLMAMQGFIGITTRKENDEIVQTNSKGHQLRTRKLSGGVITQTFIGEQNRTITKRIYKDSIGQIIEEIVEAI